MSYQKFPQNFFDGRCWNGVLISPFQRNWIIGGNAMKTTPPPKKSPYPICFVFPDHTCLYHRNIDRRHPGIRFGWARAFSLLCGDHWSGLRNPGIFLGWDLGRYGQRNNKGYACTFLLFPDRYGNRCLGTMRHTTRFDLLWIGHSFPWLVLTCDFDYHFADLHQYRKFLDYCRNRRRRTFRNRHYHGPPSAIDRRLYSVRSIFWRQNVPFVRYYKPGSGYRGNRCI